MHFHKAQEKPQRWGNFQDVQYAIRRNMEKIYKCNSDNELLVMPLFWGLPALDYSGNANHGTNHEVQYRNGSLDFDGSNDYIFIPASAIPASGSFSISLWFKPAVTFNNSTAATDYLMKLGDSPSSNDIDIYLEGATSAGGLITDGALGFSMYTGLGRQHIESSSTSWTGGVWYNVVCNFDTTNGTELFIDSASQGTNAGTSRGSSVAASIYLAGHWHKLTTWTFYGLIDEVRISDTAHSAETIALFHDRPWDLYRPVSKPVYSLPAVGVTIPVFMQNMRGGFNPISRGGFIN